MTYQEYCDYIREHYSPRHRHLYALDEGIFARPFLRAVRSGTPAALRGLCREPHPGVFLFEMLELGFCRELLEEVEHFQVWMAAEELGVIRPNTMNNYGAVLDTFGFEPFLQALMLDYIKPLSGLFYPEVGGGSLDLHHGFVVEYELGKETKLDFHVDASDVTLNVCLGREFTGGELFFQGLRCGLCQQTEPLPGESVQVGHVPGVAVLHRGNHRHGAHPILSGARSNLILWCNSRRFGHRQQREHRPEWCGWPEPPAGDPGA
jgi:hypothetical protein